MCFSTRLGGRERLIGRFLNCSLSGEEIKRIIFTMWQWLIAAHIHICCAVLKLSLLAKTKKKRILGNDGNISAFWLKLRKRRTTNEREGKH